jgi:hypothetical protein
MMEQISKIYFKQTIQDRNTFHNHWIEEGSKFRSPMVIEVVSTQHEHHVWHDKHQSGVPFLATHESTGCVHSFHSRCLALTGTFRKPSKL